MRARPFADIGQDLSQLGRAMRSTPGFFLTCVLTIAVGISLTTVLLSVVDAILLRPLPFRDVDRLVTLGTRTESFTLPGLLTPTVDTWRAQREAFEQTEVYLRTETELGGGMEPAMLPVTKVGPGLFAMLGARPQLGRTIEPGDFEGTATPVALVSDAFWRERLGAERGAIGRKVTLGGTVYTVVGVMPPGFTFHPVTPQVWLPVTPADLAAGGGITDVIARLRMTLPAAQAWAATRAEQLAREFPDRKSWTIEIAPLGGWRANPDVTRGLWVVLGCAGCVLLIGCANTANLMMVRNASRVREIAVRSALGASRPRLTRQLLVESLALAAVSGGLGVLMANWLLVLMLPMVPSDVTFGSFYPITLDPRVLLVTSAITLGTGILFGLVPALHGSAAGEKLASMVGRSASDTRAAGRMRAVVLTTQLAFAVVLLGGAALFSKSFVRLLDVDPGVDVDRLAVMSLSLSPVRYPDSTARRLFYEELQRSLRAIPGVQDVALADGAPPHTTISFGLAMEAKGQPAPATQPEVLPNARVGQEYFETSGTRIVAGRGFEAEDYRSTRPVAVIDEGLARLLWGGASPVGQEFRLTDADPWLTVVGVAATARMTGPGDRSSGYGLYRPLRSARASGTFLVRTAGDPAALIGPMRQALRKLDAGQPVARLATMTHEFGDAVAKPRFFLWLMLTFGAAALVLASIGIYGTAAFAARRRSRELAIRMALGASEGTVMGHVLRQSGRGIAVGLAIGLGATLLLSRMVSGLLFEVGPTDVGSLGSAVALLGVTAFVAGYIPAARVVRSEPFRVLRSE